MDKKGPEHRPSKKLRIIKALVAARQYNYSKKVQLFIEEGDFEPEDMEQCILSAGVVHKIEPDDLCNAVDGYKYTILGVDTQGMPFYTCGKLIRNADSQTLYFFITAHEQQ